MEALGEKVNIEKSEIFFLNASPEIERNIFNIMDFRKGEFPCKYLGKQLEKGAKDSKTWNPILDKIDKYIGNWNRK